MEKTSLQNSCNFSINNKEKSFAISSVYCIGYSGSNSEKVQKHIDELAEIGIPRPPEVPMLYPMRISSLNQNGNIEIIGEKTSGEAEIVLIFGKDESEIYICVGSDHTDRALEEVDINKSKQICDKPLACEAWELSSVKSHWDELKLLSKVLIDGKWKPYQEQNITAILPLNKILAYLNKKSLGLKNSIIFAGTVPLLDGFKYGDAYKVELKDPVKDKSISCTYFVKNLNK